MNITSRAQYLRSLSLELDSQASRVRNLIGDIHWLTDGRHKESLLRDLIQRHCPATVIVSSGFVLSSTKSSLCSTEQDILVIDSSQEAPVFRQDEVSIAFPNSVIAAISVKSSMTNSTISSVIKGLKTVRDVARESSVQPDRIWCGGFFYGVDEDYQSDPIKIYSAIGNCIMRNPSKKPIIPVDTPIKMGPDIMCDSNDFAFLIDGESASNEPSIGQIRGYGCNGGATSVFLGALLEHITWYISKDRSVFSDFLVDLETSQLNPPTYVVKPNASKH